MGSGTHVPPPPSPTAVPGPSGDVVPTKEDFLEHQPRELPEVLRLIEAEQLANLVTVIGAHG
ncbi:hypothetical protein, partial [Streptomyces prunicolor]|uniref:hypothetical protein n=1 Tax=Streptomyces prunicolor TaxID=67348 RepID=UPI0033DE4316